MKRASLVPALASVLGGDAGATEADVKMRCAAQGNAEFVAP